MGDRIGLCVRDRDGEESEIIIHSHWMGRELIALAQKYLKQRKHIIKNENCDRVLYDFIWWIGFNQMETDIDLTIYDDDCGDNGIFWIDLKEMTVS